MQQQDLGSIECSSISSGDSTTQETHFIHGSMFIYFGQRDVGHYGVLRKGAGTHEVKDLLAFTSEPGGLIGHQTLTLGHPK